MRYTNIATNQLYEIHLTTFWCYFDPHGKTTWMSNDPQKGKQRNGQHQW